MKRYFVANWKMYVGSPKEAAAILKATTGAMRGKKDVETVICPPALFLTELKKGYRGPVVFGVQDVFAESKGPWTGGQSAGMASLIGAEYAIVGHSERRALGDTDVVVEKKLKHVLAEGMRAILCIGERERDRGGDYFGFIEQELTSALRTVSKKDIKKLIIAYEPIFAIGKSADEALTPAGVEEMVIFIRKTLAGLFGHEHVKGVPILYGGAVEPANAGSLAGAHGLAGFLVGHASVRPNDITEIIRAL